MRDFTEEFRCVSLFLKRISFIRAADDLDVVRDQFPFLAFALRRNQRTGHPNRSASAEPLNVCVVLQCVALCDDLKIAQRRAVVQLDEGEILRIPARAHPSYKANLIHRHSAL